MALVIDKKGDSVAAGLGTATDVGFLTLSSHRGIPDTGASPSTQRRPVDWPRGGVQAPSSDTWPTIGFLDRSGGRGVRRSVRTKRRRSGRDEAGSRPDMPS